MATAALPSWLDPELLRWLILAALALLAYLLFLVLWFVRRLVAKLVLLSVLVGLGVSLWVQRADLKDCALTCQCTLYGLSVEIPLEQLPEHLRSLDNTGEVVCTPASGTAI